MSRAKPYQLGREARKVDPKLRVIANGDDVVNIARQYARSSGLGASSAGKFFQLMNDIGLSPSDADSVRLTVLSVR